jgi:hypothetical protein
VYFAAKQTVNFDSFFRFVDFPTFDRFDFVDPPPPLTYFVSALTDLVEQINSSGTRIICSDTDIGSMFVFLIASLLLNGLRPAGLLPAMAAFQSFFPGFDEIVRPAEQEADQHTQGSIIAARILNANCALPFLRTVMRKESWVAVFYHKSAQIACDTVLEMAVMSLEPVMNSVEFVLTDVPDIVTKAAPALVQRFVTVPAFPYLELEECTSPDELVPFISRQLTYGLRPKRMKAFSLHVPQFHFILEVANCQFEFTNEELLSFIAFTRKLAEEGTARASVSLLKKQNTHELWIAEALRRHVLPTWLLFLVVSRSVVTEYYEEDATWCDLYRANRFVAQVYRIVTQ